MDSMMHLPEYYIGNSTMEELQGIMSTKINALAADLGQTIDEQFVSTATQILSRYEKVFNLAVDVSKPDSFRRERISARMVSAGTTTKQMIADVSASFSNGIVEVTEDNTNNKFSVTFTGTIGVPANLVDLQVTIEEIKPAHLTVEYVFIYNTYNKLALFRYNNLAAYKYDQLRNGVIS